MHAMAVAILAKIGRPGCSWLSVAQVGLIVKSQTSALREQACLHCIGQRQHYLSVCPAVSLLQIAEKSCGHPCKVAVHTPALSVSLSHCLLTPCLHAQIRHGATIVASVTRRSLMNVVTGHDHYVLTVAPHVDSAFMVALALVLDAIFD